YWSACAVRIGGAICVTKVGTGVFVFPAKPLPRRRCATSKRPLAHYLWMARKGYTRSFLYEVRDLFSGSFVRHDSGGRRRIISGWGSRFVAGDGLRDRTRRCLETGRYALAVVRACSAAGDSLVAASFLPRLARPDAISRNSIPSNWAAGQCRC